MTTGVLYVATGKQFVKEAAASAHSIRRYAKWPTTLMTDAVEYARSLHVFTDVQEIQGYTTRVKHAVKIDGLLRMPYDQTLFLDTDTYVCADISDIFGVLDRYDIAMVHTPRRQTFASNTTVPAWFPEPNSGVIVARRSAEMLEFVARWRKIFDELFVDSGFYNDQISLRTALWTSNNILWYVLPCEYNFRTVVPGFAGAPVRIIHGRGKLAQQAHELNSARGMRIWLPRHGVLNRKELDI